MTAPISETKKSKSNFTMGNENDLEAPLIDEFSMESREEVQDDLSEDEGEVLARQETEAHAWLRSRVTSALISLTIFVSVAVFGASLRAEQIEFRSAFEDAAMALLAAVDTKFQHQLEAIEGLALDVSAFAINTESEWPEVTVKHFTDHAKIAESLFHAKSVILTPLVHDKEEWEQYSREHSKDQISTGKSVSVIDNHVQRIATEMKAHDGIFNLDGSELSEGPFAPVWQVAPANVTDLVDWINLNLFSVPVLQESLHRSTDHSQTVMSRMINMEVDSVAGNDSFGDFVASITGITVSNQSSPVIALHYPVSDENNETVAALSIFFELQTLLIEALQPSTRAVDCVIRNSFGQAATFRVDGSSVTFVGYDDRHEAPLSSLQRSSAEDAIISGIRGQYTITVFPSKGMFQYYVNGSPILYSATVIFVFFVAGIVFYLYDIMVQHRQKSVLEQAVRSNAILSSLFPENVRDRLFRRDSEDGGAGGSVASSPIDMTTFTVDPTKMRLKSFLSDAENSAASTKPIADLFPNCTVLFADISGFTAWSSLRDPSQVFTLLENVYHDFDKIARKRGVFKVETIGDSYVAVTGLPDPQEDHAVIMAKFAFECRQKMGEITHRLELTLGPDTGDLRMRFGLHSGPVTAGVLRGEKSRFQLFGDTVNTAARMESTGMRDKIQCSQSTADCLHNAGKGHWLSKRETLVHAKGKGEMQTYFIEVVVSSKQRRRNSNASQSSALSNLSSASSQKLSNIWGQNEELPEYDAQRSKHQRLVDYNVDLLKKHLKHIVARRQVLNMAGRRCSQGGLPPRLHASSNEQSTVLEEVTEVIRLPSFDAKAFKKQIDPESIDLGPAVEAQLKRYVSIIAAMYRSNPFHNFEHASHVTMSVNKLLQRVVEPSITVSKKSQVNSTQAIASNLHNYTFGITSDPLTQFAIVFSALIHDSDHWGVSNAQMIKEGAPIAAKYNNKSVAEQNSIDLAWDLLTDSEEYGDLQRCIFPTDAEYKRFRQVVVNLVMATDIFDAELLELRTARWNKVFRERAPDEEPDPDDENRKATIVIEHIMQASDVAHTMQHWHVYQKWNRRLFDELYTAWKAGRMGADPATFWYKGELKFFDSYIIPLAKKLNDCKVFGVSSDECLSYALANRAEWESKGQQIVDELVANWTQREREEAERSDPHARRKGGRRVARRRSLITTGG